MYIYLILFIYLFYKKTQTAAKSRALLKYKMKSIN
jgi:hypothetical protein